jgi:hypothetical protein
MQKKVVKLGVLACVLALMAAGLSIAQQAGGQGGGRRGGFGGPGGGPGGNFDPAQFRQRMAERMKEQLGADDQAGKVIEPRLMKVMELNRQTQAGGRGGMMAMFGAMRGQRGGPGGPGGDQGGPQGMRGRGPQGEPTAVEKAMAQLRTTLQNQSASADEIKTALTNVRAAREKARQELAVAQQDLKKILTVRQEAILVEMGQLD